MIWRAVAAVLLLAGPSEAEDVTSAEGAILRWIDKMSGETADIELTRGQSAISGQMTILLDECRYPTENPASDGYAHLTITDARVTSGPVFAGWMVASSPALSALDHARYDVWVLRCITPEAPAVVEDEPATDEGEGE